MSATSSATPPVQHVPAQPFPAAPLPFLVRRAAVLGAGTMGSRIAAHLANAGIPTLLLDMIPAGEGATQPSRARSPRCSGQGQTCRLL